MYRSKNKIAPVVALLCYITSALLLAPSSVFCFDSERHLGVEFEPVSCFPVSQESEVKGQISDLCCDSSPSRDASCHDVTVHGTTVKSNSRSPRANIYFNADKFRPNWDRVVHISHASLHDPAYKSLQASLILKQVRTVVMIR